MSARIQEVISNIVITDKNEKLCQTTGKPGTEGAFSDKVTRDIDVFLDEPEIQCVVQVAENALIDDSKYK